jgi:hypothetical protein
MLIHTRSTTILWAQLGNPGKCPPSADGQTRQDCVLPVNANITLKYSGAGVLTDVEVSIDVYPDGSLLGPSKDPALQHNNNAPSGIVATNIRVVFPPGFFVCSDISTISGGLQGVNLISLVNGEFTARTLPFQRVNPSNKGSGIAEPSLPLCEAPDNCKNQPRTGFQTNDYEFFECQAARFSSNPLQCANRMFELQSYSNMQSSSIEFVVERIKFTIQNVLVNETTGEVPSPASSQQAQFAVQIYRVTLSGGTPTNVQRYFNNRIRDKQLKTGTAGICNSLPTASATYAHCWFDGTDTIPANIISNSLNDAIWMRPLATVHPSYTSEPSSTVSIQFLVRTPIPSLKAGSAGKIFICLPSGFKPNDDALIALYNLTDPAGSNITSPGPTACDIYELCAATSSCSLNVMVPARVAPFTMLAVRVTSVQTPRALFSGDLTGTVTGEFAIYTTGLNGNIRDEGTAPGLILRSGQLKNLSVQLQDFSAGATGDLNLSFVPSNSVQGTANINIRLPRDEFDVFWNRSMYCNGVLAQIIAKTVDFIELQVIASEISAGRSQEFCVHSVTNRPFAGPPRESSRLTVRTEASNGFVFDTADIKLSDALTYGLFLPGKLQLQSLFLPTYTGDIGNFTVVFRAMNPLPFGGFLQLEIPSYFTLPDPLITVVEIESNPLEAETLQANLSQSLQGESIIQVFPVIWRCFQFCGFHCDSER